MHYAHFRFRIYIYNISNYQYWILQQFLFEILQINDLAASCGLAGQKNLSGVSLELVNSLPRLQERELARGGGRFGGGGRGGGGGYSERRDGRFNGGRGGRGGFPDRRNDRFSRGGGGGHGGGGGGGRGRGNNNRRW